MAKNKGLSKSGNTVKSPVAEIRSRFVMVSLDYLRNKFRDVAERSRSTGGLYGSISIFLATALGSVTADFNSWGGGSAEFWSAVFVILVICSAISTIVLVVRLILSQNSSVKEVMKKIEEDADKGIA